MDLVSDVRSSWQLYRLISRESLHLRSGTGRDDALIKQLALKLNLDPSKPIPKQLETKKVSIEEFIQAFFLLAEPFAEMLNNIYVIMQRHGACSVHSSISMKFSFRNVREELEFSLEKFREWQVIYRKSRGMFTIRMWTTNDFNQLYKPVRILCEIYGENRNWDHEHRYSKPLPKPHLLYTDSGWRPLLELRDAMERLRQIASGEATDVKNNVVSVLTKENSSEQAEYDPYRVRVLISDLWPGLLNLLFQLETETSHQLLTTEAKSALQQIGHVIQEIHKTSQIGKNLVPEFIELLRLPFWKYRWRVYEVWTMFKFVEALEDYDVALELVGDRLALEESVASKIASFKDSDGVIYEMWSQLKTVVTDAYMRKHIMPDLRLCKPDASIPENTLIVIECKQRKSMNEKELRNLAIDYTNGARNSILVLFVNYDEFPNVSSPFPQVNLLSKFSPLDRREVKFFRDVIVSVLTDNGIKPVVLKFDAILFDVSSSMRDEYLRSEVSTACRELLDKNPNSKVFLFSDSLQNTHGVSAGDLALKLDTMVSGSTNVNGALQQLLEEQPNIKRVAVVTDGGYNGPINVRGLFEVLEEFIIDKNFPIKPPRN